MLDMGCGLGLYLENYAGLSLGIDLSPANIEACKKKGLNVLLADANFFWTKKVWDSVLLVHVLEHLEDPSKTLINAWKNTNLRGRIIIVVPSLLCFMNGFNNLIGHRQFINETYVHHYLSRLGCKKIKSYTFPPISLPYFGRYQELRMVYQKR